MNNINFIHLTTIKNQKIELERKKLIRVIRRINLEKKARQISKCLDYIVNKKFIIEGWIPTLAIPIDENYFINREAKLEYFGFKKIRGEKSYYKDDGKPCLVFYEKKLP